MQPPVSKSVEPTPKRLSVGRDTKWSYGYNFDTFDDSWIAAGSFKLSDPASHAMKVFESSQSTIHSSVLLSILSWDLQTVYDSFL